MEEKKTARRMHLRLWEEISREAVVGLINISKVWRDQLWHNEILYASSKGVRKIRERLLAVARILKCAWISYYLKDDIALDELSRLASKHLCRQRQQSTGNEWLSVSHSITGFDIGDYLGDIALHKGDVGTGSIAESVERLITSIQLWASDPDVTKTPRDKYLDITDYDREAAASYFVQTIVYGPLRQVLDNQGCRIVPDENRYYGPHIKKVTKAFCKILDRNAHDADDLGEKLVYVGIRSLGLKRDAARALVESGCEGKRSKRSQKMRKYRNALPKKG
jgi:hypothetical protein